MGDDDAEGDVLSETHDALAIGDGVERVGELGTSGEAVGTERPARRRGLPERQPVVGVTRRAEGLDFDLPNRFEAASMTAGQKVAIGVRPEYVRPEFAVPIEGKITFVESQGREVPYDLTLAGGKVFRSIQGGGRKFKLGENVRWGIDIGAMFFFDGQGNRI